MKHRLDMEYVSEPKDEGCTISLCPLVVLLFLVALIVGVAVGLGVYFGVPNCTKACDSEDSAIVSSTTTPVSTTSSPPPLPQDVRLPGNIKPNHYELLLIPDIYQDDPKDFTFTGTVEMNFTVISSTDTITVHYTDLEITVDYIKATGSNENLVNGDPTTDPLREFFKIPVQKDKLVEGNDYIAKFTFTGPIKDDLFGIYYGNYQVNGTTRYLLASQLQPTAARKVFPCLDEPSLKASFGVKIQRKKHMTSMGNTKIINTTPVPDKADWEQDEYSRTPIMSTYLFAVVVSDLQCIQTSTSAGKAVYICSRASVIDDTQFAASIAGDVQDFFESYHNITYSLSKTIHVAVPQRFSWAMENWGLIIYEEPSLLFNADIHTATRKQAIAIAMAHELSHQWFGNIVTCAWWDDLWLNEGFAHYMTWVGAENSLPTWELTDYFVVGVMHPVLVDDSTLSSHPVYRPLYNPADIIASFDLITYNKGASLIRLMRNIVGEDTFRNGISNYIKGNAYVGATHSDIFQYLKAETGNTTDVPHIMEGWLKETGYPVVMYDYDKDSGKLTVSQKRFLLDSASATDEELGVKWEVPVTYVTNENTTSDTNSPSSESIKWLWSTDDNVELTGVTGDWVLGNVQEQFFYRVNYNRENWHALVKQFHDDHLKFHQINRAQIIDDAFNLARANLTGILVAMNISLYMEKEEFYLPWNSFLRNIDYVSNMMSTSPKYGYFREFLKIILAPQHDILGWNEDPVTSPHTEQLLRSEIIPAACMYGLESCVSNATKEYKDYMDGTESTSPNLRGAMLCNGIRHGSDKEWNFAFNKYQMATSDAERGLLAKALACTNEPWLLRGYIQSMPVPVTAAYLAAHPIGRSMMWDYWKNTDTLGHVQQVTKWFSSESELNELEKLMEHHPDRHNEFIGAIETVKSNIQWRLIHGSQIEHWLEHNFGSAFE